MKSSQCSKSSSLVEQAARELEEIRRVPKHVGAQFPTACQWVLSGLPGNECCVDCGSPNPEWASVTFGSLICMRCSGKHRSYGVKTSFVRSIRMDAWTHEHILAMLEGETIRVESFFDRHEMGDFALSQTSSRRYHTKAAKFYRTSLAKHVESVSESGVYKGREDSRRSSRKNIGRQGNRRHHQQQIRACERETNCRSDNGILSSVCQPQAVAVH